MARRGRDHVCRRPEQVAAVGRAERPGQLYLAEAEQPGPGGYWPLPLALIAYLLGAIGMIGSGIWLMWLISLIHWPGLRMLLTSAESFLLPPNSGVNSIWTRLPWSGRESVFDWPL